MGLESMVSIVPRSFFARGQVHGGIHASGEAEKDYHVADDAAEGRAADLFGGATLCSLISNGLKAVSGRFLAARLS